MSLFNIWIDTPITSGDQNVISYDTLNQDAQRARGFKAGEAASALRVNTMLRQSSLVIKALMDIIDNSGKLSVTSTSKDVYDIFNKYFNSFATKATTNSLSENISTVESNLDTLIEGLDNGTKVVNNAQNAVYAASASNADNSLNANNSQKILDVDLEADYPANFGNYIVRKEKLVNSNEYYLGRNGTEQTIYTSTSSLVGRSFRILFYYKDDTIDYRSVIKSITIKIDNFGKSIPVDCTFVGPNLTYCGLIITMTDKSILGSCYVRPTNEDNLSITIKEIYEVL